MTVKTENISKTGPVKVKDGSAHLKTVAMRAYSGQKKESIENERIAEFLQMVPKIANRVITYLRPPLSFEDLVAAGTVGLVKAARNYDPSRQTEFKTYAYIRIRGAILDELKKWSFVSENLAKQIKNAARIIRKTAEQTGVEPADEELAEKLGITIDKLYKMFENARAQHFLSIDNFAEDAPALGNILASANTSTPYKQTEKAELVEKLTEAIQKLPEKKKQLILLYYQQGLTMKEIAEVFGITESRVSQLHAGALFSLSSKLRQWEDGG